MKQLEELKKQNPEVRTRIDDAFKDKNTVKKLREDMKRIQKEQMGGKITSRNANATIINKYMRRHQAKKQLRNLLKQGNPTTRKEQMKKYVSDNIVGLRDQMDRTNEIVQERVDKRNRAATGFQNRFRKHIAKNKLKRLREAKAAAGGGEEAAAVEGEAAAEEERGEAAGEVARGEGEVGGRPGGGGGGDGGDGGGGGGGGDAPAEAPAPDGHNFGRFGRYSSSHHHKKHHRHRHRNDIPEDFYYSPPDAMKRYVGRIHGHVREYDFHYP